MNYTHRSAATLLAALSALLATPNANAQVVIPPEQAQGLFSTWGVSFTCRGAADPVLIHAPGFANGIPSPWTAAMFGDATADHPDFSTLALFQHWSLPPNTQNPVFGDISTGSDLMPFVRADGTLNMNYFSFSHWYALTIAVANNAVGKPGSMVALRRAGGRNPAGDIISYYAIGSAEINPRLVDTVRLEASREQLQLGSIAGFSGPQEITNLDYNAGVESANRSGGSNITFPVHNKLYFTLTQTWVNSVINTSFTIGGKKPNASTVYVTTWSPTTGWAFPTVAFSHDELFGTIPVGEIEIDALSVDEGSVGTMARAVVFSLTPQSDVAVGRTFDQILVYQRDPVTGLPNTATQALMTDPNAGTSTTISSRLGLIPRAPGIEPDNVTSSCGIDPRDGHAVEAGIGHATDELVMGDGDLGLSAFRSCPVHPDGSIPVDLLTFQVTGMQYTPWQIGYVRFYIEGPVSQPGQPLNPYVWQGDPIWIDPAQQQNSIDQTIQVSHTTNSPPSPLRVSATCFGLDLSTNPPTPKTLRKSWVVTIGT